jgi:hypothetical protein
MMDMDIVTGLKDAEYEDGRWDKDNVVLHNLLYKNEPENEDADDLGFVLKSFDDMTMVELMGARVCYPSAKRTRVGIG